MTEDEVFKNRISDLDKGANSKSYYTFTDFMSMDEVSTLKSMKVGKYILFGGYNMAERCVAAFGDFDYEPTFPIVCIKIAPVSKKFSDELTHRDFLGAVMNLGIERKTIGDIVIFDNVGYMFTLEKMSRFILENLTKIKHTDVTLSLTSELPNGNFSDGVEGEYIVSSLRCDSLISEIYNMSRNNASLLFSAGKVYVNSRRTDTISKNISSGDTVAVRGYGKFIFEKQVKTTKKGRLVINVKVFK